MNLHPARSGQLYHSPGAHALASTRLRPAAALALTAAALCSLSAVIAFRTAITRAAPALERLYAAAGLPTTPAGPVFLHTTSSTSEAASGRVLVVEGEIANLTERATPVADLRISVRADDGREIYHWTAPSPKSSLGPGETIAFRAKLASPPDGARRVTLDFAGQHNSPSS